MIKKIIHFMVGSVGAQIVAFLLTPVVTRLYVPEQYGVFTLYLSISVILSSFSIFKLDQAIYKTNHNSEENKKLLGVIFLQLLLMMIVIFIVGVIASLFLEKYYFLWVFLGVASLSLFDIAIAIAVNFNKIKKIRNYRLIQALVISAVQVVFYYVVGDYIGLILGHVTGYILFFILISRDLSISVRPSFNFFDYKYVMMSFSGFIKFQAPASLLNSLAQNFIVIALAYGYGEHYAGLYGLTYKVLTLPNAMIGNSVRQVFYKTAEEIKNNHEKLNKIYNKTTLLLFGISLTGFGLGYFLYDKLFPMVFGSEWAVAATISKLLTPWFIFMLVNSPSITIFNVLNKQKEYFYFEVINTLSRVSIILITQMLTSDFYILLKLYVVQAVIMNVLIIFIAKKILLCKTKKDCIN